MLHENYDLLMKFRKEDEENALLTEQNERQVLSCITSPLLNDDAKIHAKSARLYNFLGNWREMKTVFRRNIFIRTDDLLI